MEPVVVLRHSDLGEHLRNELLVGLDARGKVSSRRNGERGYAPCEKQSDLKKNKT